MEKEVIIEIQKGKPPIQEMVKLARTYYDSGEIISLDYLRWQYIRNPFGLPFLTTSKWEHKLVGQYIVIPINYKFKSKKLRGTLSLNTLTHSDFRGQGLFIKMANSTYTECEKQNTDFTVGFPNPLSHSGFVKKLKFETLGYSKLLVSPLKPFSIIKDFISKNKPKHGGDIPFNPDLVKSNKIDIIRFTEEDSNLYNVFWENLQINKITIDKQFNFIKWRYFDLPGRKYYLLKVINENKMTSFISLRTEKVLGTNTAVLMDFYTLNEFEYDGKILLSSLKKELKRQGINLIATLRSNVRVTKKILKRSSFYKIPNKLMPQPIPVIYRSHQKENVNKELDNYNNWSFSFGDYDIF